MRHSYLCAMVAALLALACPIALANPPLDTNLLQNSGFESGSAGGWVVQAGAYDRRSSNPYAGSWCYYGGPHPSATIYQDFDLEAMGYDPNRLATGGYLATFGGSQRSDFKFHTLPSGISVSWSDTGSITLDQFDDGRPNASSSLGEYDQANWTARQDTVRLQPGTTDARYQFHAVRQEPPGVPWQGFPAIMAYLDATYLKIHEATVWSTGQNSQKADLCIRSAQATVRGQVSIGEGGNGNFYVSQATCRFDDWVYLGEGASAAGTINVLQDGRLITEDLTLVGASGSGGVAVGSGASWQSQGTVRLGSYGGSGAVTINGGGTWDSGRVEMGLEGGTAPVKVDCGGVWNSNLVIMRGGEIDVCTGGAWNSTGQVWVGAAGEDATVNIEGGIWTSSDDVNVSGGEIVVAPSGTWNALVPCRIGYRFEGEVNVNFGGTWNCGLGVAVGDEGTGTVNVNAGGSWTVGMLSVGTNGGNGTVNVAGGVLETTTTATVGTEGTGAVKVSSGGTWNDKAIATVIGDHLGNGEVVLEAGATWNVDRSLFIANQGDGRVTVLPEATLTTAGAVRVGAVGKWEGTAFLGVGELELLGTWTANGEIWVGKDGAIGVVWAHGTWNTNGPVTVGGGGGWNGQVLVAGNWNATAAVTVGFPSPGYVVIDGGCLDATELTLGRDGELRFDDGGTLVVTGGTARLSGLVEFQAGGGTIRLDNGHLVRDVETLDLNGGQITGIGQIDAPLGVMLGPADRPGSLTGTGPTERLAVYADVTGSGSLANVDIHGHVGVGNSAGEMSLANVLLGDGSSMAMEVLGLTPDECDRLRIGPGVDSAGCPIDIAFAGGFTPDATDTFDLFDELPGGDLAAALGTATIQAPIDWQLNLSTGTLSYIPEPASLALLALGGLAVIRRRRM